METNKVFSFVYEITLKWLKHKEQLNDEWTCELHWGTKEKCQSCCQYTHQLIVLSCRIMAQIIYHSLTLEHISLSLGLRLDLKAVKSGLLIAIWWRLLKAYAYWKQMQGDLCSRWEPSSETQGQIVGARESLNRRKNMAQKKSKERPEEPLGTMSYQTSSKRSLPSWLLIWCYMK